jgi:putative transposase
LTDNYQILITQEETLAQTIDCLMNHITVNSQGAFTTKDLLHLLVRTASNNDSIENTSKILKNTPSGRNIRYHLDKFNDFEELEFQVNLALKSQILPGIRKGKLKLAIDLNLIPYYGEYSEEEKPYIYRSQAKQGTCSFYAYGTLYVIKNNKRFTLAIKGIRNTDTNVAIITYLLSYIYSLNINLKTLYLDRGFFSVSVIRWLKALKIPFILPAIRRGKNGGIKQFLKGRKNYKTTYAMTNKQGDCVTFELWVICKYLKGKRKKKGIEYFAYVVHKPTISLDYIHQDYRKRFGIESSYRIKNICRIKTTNKKPIIRLLFIGISFILINVWVNLLWRKVSLPRKGSRLIYRELFTFKQMLSFLRQAIDQLFQVINTIYLPSG